METGSEHRDCVNAWLDSVAPDLSSEALVELFEAGFAAVWSRAHQTLGGVTLLAIARRVLHRATEQHPGLAALELETTGLSCKKLYGEASRWHREQLIEGLGDLLVSFLSVLGNLTADVLTPALHAALSRVGIESGGPGDLESRRERRNAAHQREDLE